MTLLIIINCKDFAIIPQFLFMLENINETFHNSWDW